MFFSCVIIGAFKNGSRSKPGQISRLLHHFFAAVSASQTPFPSLRTHLSCAGEQISTRHPQVRQGEQRHHLSGVLYQAQEAHLRITKLALDHPKWMLNLGANLSLGFLDLAYRFVQRAAFAMFFVGAAVGHNLPDDLASLM